MLHVVIEKTKCVKIVVRHGLMLLWFKNLMNITEKLQFIDPTFRNSCLVPSLRGDLNAATRGPFIRCK